MSRTTLAVLLILTVALAAWAGDTGLGTSPFTSGDQLTATSVNAMNDAINDNNTAIEALNGYFANSAALEDAASLGDLFSATLQKTTQPVKSGQPLTPSKI
jgi:hypothetical protein